MTFGWCLAVPALALLLAGCGSVTPDEQVARQALRAHGCIHCHRIDGVTGAHGRVGPPLSNLAQRKMIAGTEPNDEERLVRFIIAPTAISPGSAMPVTGIGPDEARAVARFLRQP